MTQKEAIKLTKILFKKYNLNWNVKVISTANLYDSKMRLGDLVIGRASSNKMVFLSKELLKNATKFINTQNILHEVAHAILMERCRIFSSGHNFLWAFIALRIGYKFPNYKKDFFDKHSFNFNIKLKVTKLATPEEPL